MGQTRFVAYNTQDVMLQVLVRDENGAGRTGLAYNTADLGICVRRLGGTLTTLTYSDSNIESVTTLGTYQAPSSSSKVRFREVSDDKFPGLYELHFHNNGVFDAADATTSIVLSITGPTNTIGDLIHIQYAPIVANSRLVADVDMKEALAEPTTPLTGTVQDLWTPLDWLSFLGRFVANKMTLNRATAEMIVYRDDGVTSLTEQAVSDDGDVQTRESAS